MHRTFFLALFLGALLPERSANAEMSARTPAGGGLPSLDVRVDLESATVDANGSKLRIALERSELPREGDVVVEALPIGLGRQVVHVRVPAKRQEAGIAWEAILAAGRNPPIFAGMTGLTAGDPGERTGKLVQVVANGALSFVIVADTREDLRICGQSTTLLQPMALYPASLQLRPATMQRLGSAQQTSAQTLVATDVAADDRPHDPPLARLLAARGSSVVGSSGADMTDGDPKTVWSERRPGAGQGEFVVMEAPEEVRIPRIKVVLGPPNADRSGSAAAPQSFFLVTTTQTFRIVLPSDARLGSTGAYDVVFPQALEASCLSLVLDGTYARRGARDFGPPDVGVADIVAYSEFDLPGATLDDVANKLSGERRFAAAQVLERAGGAALAAVEKAYDRLDAQGRALAVDVAAAREHCAEAAPLLVRALCERDDEASRKAREKMARCRDAVPLLARRLREDASARACVAPVLSALAPEEALEPIADAIASTGEGDRDTRAALRVALGEALKAAAPGRLTEVLADRRRNAGTRLEILRAAGGRVSESVAEGEAIVADLLSSSPSMRTRYLVLGPIGELARAGAPSALARLSERMNDGEWPVRARAAEVAGGVSGAQAGLVEAASDPEPRVREAALQSLASLHAGRSPGAVEAAERALSAANGSRRWTFVAVPAIAVLAGAAPSPKIDDALGAALSDPSSRVRIAALDALASRRAVAWRDAMRGRLDDKAEDPDVRAAAARALGTMCDVDSVQRLTTLAHLLAVPSEGEDEQQVALGALFALAALKPHDLRERVAPLLTPTAPPQVRAAAQQALSAAGSCR